MTMMATSTDSKWVLTQGMPPKIRPAAMISPTQRIAPLML